MDVLRAAGMGEGGELAELLWAEMGLAPDAHVTQARPFFFIKEYKLL